MELYLHDCLQPEGFQVLEIFNHGPAAAVNLARNDNPKVDWAAIFLCLGDHFCCLEVFDNYLVVIQSVRGRMFAREMGQAHYCSRSCDEVCSNRGSGVQDPGRFKSLNSH